MEFEISYGLMLLSGNDAAVALAGMLVVVSHALLAS